MVSCHTGSHVRVGCLAEGRVYRKETVCDVYSTEQECMGFYCSRVYAGYRLLSICITGGEGDRDRC